MSNITRHSDNSFVEVGYAAKIAFAHSHETQDHPDIHAIWQQSQGLWKNHGIFRNMPVGNVITWLRGEDSDV